MPVCIISGIDMSSSAWYRSLVRAIKGNSMEKNNRDGEELVGFFQEALRKAPEEEVKNIIETQKIIEEFLVLEEKPQVYQLQVTSNW